MKLTILGSFSAYPSHKGFTTSQVLEHNGKSFLIDCGEGTQLQLRKNKIKLNSIQSKTFLFLIYMGIIILDFRV